MLPAKQSLDFIVIGAQKAGTTSLFEYLRSHPDICLPPHKEAPFFSHDAIWTRGWDRYLDNTFAGCDPTRRWGTITTHYMVGGVYDAWSNPRHATLGYDERTVPSRIRDRSPEVRLVALLRDPVARAVSHHRMMVMNRVESRPLEQAVEDLLRPEALQRARRLPQETTGYVAWGEYGRILSGYVDVFEREQLLIVFTDELARAPERVLRRIYEFIGIPEVTSENLGRRFRQGSSARRFRWIDPYAAQRALARNHVARGLWRALPERTRRRSDRVLADVAYRSDLWNRRDTATSESPSTDVLDRLDEHFLEDSERLAKLVGEPLPWQHAAAAQR